MQTSGKKACFLFPECSLSYTKIILFFNYRHVTYIKIQIILFKFCKARNFRELNLKRI